VEFSLLNGKKPKHIALVGFAESTRHLAPYSDPDVCIMAMNQLYRHIPRANVWWEVHKREEYLADQVPGTDYLKWLQECPIPIMMIDTAPDIPNSVRMPIEDWSAEFGDYFYSTISYMLAYAIMQQPEEISIWGIDLAHDSEYEYQKPSAEYLIGIARGRGIKVTIPPESALVRGMYRYGYQSMPSNEDIQWLTVYKDRVSTKANEVVGQLNQTQGKLNLVEELNIGGKVYDDLDQLRQQQIGLMNMLQGQLAAAEEFLMWARSKRRGSAPPDPNMPNPDLTAKDT